MFIYYYSEQLKHVHTLSSSNINIDITSCLFYLKTWAFESTYVLLQHHNKLKIEAMEKGATSYKIDKLRRNHEMDEYDLVHWRRSVEEREALLRDISWYSFKTSTRLYLY